jgi:hypothetical protein
VGIKLLDSKEKDIGLNRAEDDIKDMELITWR